MANKIIFDSIITGHHSEYISHLVDFIVSSQFTDNYYFVVSEELKNKFPEIIMKTHDFSNIYWDFIPKSILEEMQGYSLIKRSFLEFNLVSSYTKKIESKEVLLLYFNIFQLSLVFKRPKFTISGILFLQFLRMPTNTFRDKIKYFRKFFITKLYSLNKSLKSIFILNDFKTVEVLNRKFNTKVFKMLPDPIPIFEEEIGFNVFEHYNIPSQKKILLHPGAIDPRKGTYEIINSVDLLEDHETTSYVILIVGRAKKNIESEILRRIESLKNKKFQIIFDNSFVSNERLKSLFLQSEAVLMPYKNPEASSGILGHAILASKCVVAPNAGLIGEIIRENNFGLVIDSVTSVEIAKAIHRIEDFKMNISDVDKFIEKHSSVKFSKILLKGN